MKKLFMLPLALFLTVPAFAQSRTYDSNVPVIEEEEYIEVDEDLGDRMERDRLEQERMEAREEARLDRSMEDHRSYDGIDYTAPDRNRTNRERRALNTSGDASDDK